MFTHVHPTNHFLQLEMSRLSFRCFGGWIDPGSRPGRFQVRTRPGTLSRGRPKCRTRGASVARRRRLRATGGEDQGAPRPGRQVMMVISSWIERE